MNSEVIISSNSLKCKCKFCWETWRHEITWEMSCWVHTYTFNHSFYKRKAQCLLTKWYKGISVNKCLWTWLNFSFTLRVQMWKLTPQSVTKTQYARRLNNNKHVDHATPTWELSTTDWKQEENAGRPVTMPLYSCTYLKYN
jgi:hypothetical protein